MSSQISSSGGSFKTAPQKHLAYPDVSVYAMFESTAKRHPAYISCNYFGKRFSYAEMDKLIRQCADAFQKIGVQYQERVSICMPNTPEAVISFYALNRIGAVVNMIHPLSSADEIKYYLNISQSKFCVAADFSLCKLLGVAEETALKKCVIVSVKDSMPLHLKNGYQITQGRKISAPQSSITLPWKRFLALGKSNSENSTLSLHGTDTAAILYSGGTSGYPKGIELTNLNFNALAMQSFDACGCLTEKDTVLAIMPIFHGFGLGICIHTVQYFGGESILLPRFHAKTFDRLLKKYKPNIIAGVPTLFEAMLQNKHLEKTDLSFLKCVISGGDTLTVQLKKRMDQFLKMHGAQIQVREGYGLTECVTGSCLTPEHTYKEGSIGVPYPDTYYKIVKPGTKEELPCGEVGEILISGPSVMKGYINNDAENQKTLVKHSDGRVWLYTGDAGCVDADGFVYFKQRLKRIIVSSGYNLNPVYIENVINAHPDVLISCVVGIPHPYKGEAVKACIVLNRKVAKSDAVRLSIQKHCEEKLARYSWIYEYEFLDELPKTLVGKVAFTKLMEKANNE